MGNLLLAVGLGQGGPKNAQLTRLFVNFIRLVDLGVEEYEASRGFLEACVARSGNRLSRLFAAMNHLEICVITVNRALNGLWQIVHHREAPPLDRTAKKALRAFEGPLQDVRDSVVHMEERITRRQITEGQPHVLAFSPDGRIARIAGDEISLERLAAGLRRLHEVAAELAVYRED